MPQINEKKNSHIKSHYINSNADLVATTSSRNIESQSVQKSQQEREREHHANRQTGLKRY